MNLDEPRLPTELTAAKLRSLSHYCKGEKKAEEPRIVGLAGFLAEEIEQLDATISPFEFVTRYRVAEEKAGKRYNSGRINRSERMQEFDKCLDDIHRLFVYQMILPHIIPLEFLEAVKQEYKNSGDAEWLDYDKLKERWDQFP